MSDPKHDPAALPLVAADPDPVTQAITGWYPGAPVPAVAPEPPDEPPPAAPAALDVPLSPAQLAQVEDVVRRTVAAILPAAIEAALREHRLITPLAAPLRPIADLACGAVLAQVQAHVSWQRWAPARALLESHRACLLPADLDARARGKLADAASEGTLGPWVWDAHAPLDVGAGEGWRPVLEAAERERAAARAARKAPADPVLAAMGHKPTRAA